MIGLGCTAPIKTEQQLAHTARWVKARSSSVNCGGKPAMKRGVIPTWGLGLTAERNCIASALGCEASLGYQNLTRAPKPCGEKISYSEPLTKSPNLVQPTDSSSPLSAARKSSGGVAAICSYRVGDPL